MYTVNGSEEDTDRGAVSADCLTLLLGEPSLGFWRGDVLPAIAGMSAWRRVSGLDVVFGLEGDPSALDAIPASRVVAFG
jgi:hypothetical protein